MTAETLPPTEIETIADRAIEYLNGAAVSALVVLGDQLGIYRALRDAGPVTAAEAAALSGLNERWVREWLHGQAGAGLVSYHPNGRFELTDAQAAVLSEEAGPDFLTGGFALLFSLFQGWDRLHDSFRTGRGTAYNTLGVEHAVNESRFSVPWMKANLVDVVLPQLDGVADKLAAGAKVVEIGCGSGKALVEMARAFPRSEFHGFDSAAVALELAKEHVASSGVTNVELHHAAGETLRADASFDFVLTWDCLHDMTDPAATMRAIRGAIRPEGTWLIVDINGGPTPESNYDHPLAGLLYGFSVLDCLGCSTSTQDGLALGTLGFPEPVARRMTAEAGFERFEVRDFGNPLNAFYEVRP
jgi:2-polyprenyl-3-methyl-5-hydroxy-6-metoxy-1,4-benzoquinol methylase